MEIENVSCYIKLKYTMQEGNRQCNSQQWLKTVLDTIINACCFSIQITGIQSSTWCWWHWKENFSFARRSKVNSDS